MIFIRFTTGYRARFRRFWFIYEHLSADEGRRHEFRHLPYILPARPCGAHTENSSPLYFITYDLRVYEIDIGKSNTHWYYGDICRRIRSREQHDAMRIDCRRQWYYSMLLILRRDMICFDIIASVYILIWPFRDDAFCRGGKRCGHNCNSWLGLRRRHYFEMMMHLAVLLFIFICSYFKMRVVALRFRCRRDEAIDMPTLYYFDMMSGDFKYLPMLSAERQAFDIAEASRSLPASTAPLKCYDSKANTRLRCFFCLGIRHVSFTQKLYSPRRISIYDATLVALIFIRLYFHYASRLHAGFKRPKLACYSHIAGRGYGRPSPALLLYLAIVSRAYYRQLFAAAMMISLRRILQDMHDSIAIIAEAWL